MFKKSQKSLVLELIPTMKAEEVEITFVEELMIKKMTIYDGSRAVKGKNISERKMWYHICQMGFLPETYFW